MINFLIVVRWAAAWIAHIDSRMFKMYYLVRMYTCIVLGLVNYFSLLFIIILDASDPGWAPFSVHFMWYISWALVSSFILVTDLHWTQCIGFQAYNPSLRKKPIEWLMSDSEPDWAFQKNP